MANIKRYLDKIRTAIYGKEVRGSLADGLEAINNETEDATEVAVNVEQRQDTVEQQFDDVLNEWTDDKPISNEETIAARTNRETGENHKTLGQRLDAENKKVNEQLAETEEKNPNNARYPLIIRTYDGFNRTTHPDVLYFESGWNGFKYWMVHTPFPFDNDFWENPSIVVSNDGIKWEDAPGITNPIDEVTEEENESGIYLSDAVLVYANDRLECFYRWFNKETREERFYRQWSTDGANWQGKELILDKEGTGLGMMLSPSIVHENGRYRMWVVDNPNRRVMYTESVNATDWEPFKEIPLTFSDRTAEPWHLDVYKENDTLYHLTFSEYKSSGNPRSIFHGVSSDGESFEDVSEILKTKEGASWDNGMLYRASLTKVDGRYKLYYSARAAGGIGAWRVGVVEGDSPKTLRSTENYNEDFKFEIPRITSERLDADFIRSEGISVRTGKEETPNLELIKYGVSAVNLQVGKSNTLKIINDKGDYLGDLEVRKITLDGVELYVYNDELRVLGADGNFRDFGARSIKVAEIRPHNHSVGIGLRGKTTFQSEGDNPPILKLLHHGKYGAQIEVVDTDTLEIKRDSGHSGGNLKLGSVIFEGSSVNEEGAIRYNKTTKKHQGHDGTNWNDLY